MRARPSQRKDSEEADVVEEGDWGFVEERDWGFVEERDGGLVEERTVRSSLLMEAMWPSGQYW
jgi:hypothetical protein